MCKKSNKQKVLELAVLSLLVMPVWTGVAQAADTEEETATKSRDIVVTASKQEMEIKAEPSAVEVITAEDIQRMAATNVLDALKLANNVDISGTSMVGNAIRVRGSNTNHTLILIDGKRVAAEDTLDSENYYRLSQINVNNIERIEIVRGSGSVLYGSEALGGVINIITKTPGTPKYTVGLSTGSADINNYYNFDFGKMGRWSTSLNMRFSKVRENNHPDASYYNMYGPKQYYDFKAIYDFESKEHNKLDFGFEYQKDKLTDDSVNSRTKIPYGNSYTNERYGFNLGFTGKSDKNDYMFRFYTYKYTKDSVGSTPNDAIFKNWVIEGRDILFASDAHTVTYGAEYASNSYEGTRLSASGDKASHSFNTYAGYIQDSWQLGDNLLLIPAVRYEHNSMFGSAVTPKIGMTYSMTPHTRIKVNYGRGYKAPTISELYMDWSHNAYVHIIGDPELQPEKSVNFDVSIEGEQDKSFAKLTYFKNEVSNLIDYRNTVGINYVYQNIGRALLEGVEAEYGYNFDDHWGVKISHNYLSAMDESTNTRLANRAKGTTMLQLTYDDGTENNFSAVLWDKIYSDYYHATVRMGNNYNGSHHNYSLLGLSLNKKWSKNFTTYAGVDNILDCQIDPLYEWGRTWRVGAEWTF